MRFGCVWHPSATLLLSKCVKHCQTVPLVSLRPPGILHFGAGDLGLRACNAEVWERSPILYHVPQLFYTCLKCLHSQINLTPRFPLFLTQKISYSLHPSAQTAML